MSKAPDIGWHILDPDFGEILLHSVVVGEGWLHSASAMAATAPPGFVSPYWAKTMMGAVDPRKEAVWEAVRKDVSPDLPSRMGALFLFPTKEEAETSLTDWFKDSGRSIFLRVRMPFHSAHLADGKWLDCIEREWIDCATRYWLGEMRVAPRRELVVDGRVYFPDWKMPPFRRLPAGLASVASGKRRDHR